MLDSAKLLLQSVRWVNEKEAHANKIINTVMSLAASDPVILCTLNTCSSCVPSIHAHPVYPQAAQYMLAQRVKVELFDSKAVFASLCLQSGRV